MQKKCGGNAETQGRMWIIEFPRIPLFPFISALKE
jgi:hypothetical protein